MGQRGEEQEVEAGVSSAPKLDSVFPSGRRLQKSRAGSPVFESLTRFQREISGPAAVHHEGEPS